MISKECGLPLEIEVFAEGDEICKVDARLGGKRLKCSLVGGTPALKKQLFEWIERYAAKDPSSKALPFKFPALPPFHRKVLQELQKIPFGSTLSYQEVASRLGNPEGARAVGNGCGANPFLLFIPCHRVIYASGKIGGFSSPMEIKKALLAFEKS